MGVSLVYFMLTSRRLSMRIRARSIESWDPTRRLGSGSVVRVRVCWVWAFKTFAFLGPVLGEARRDLQSWAELVLQYWRRAFHPTTAAQVFSVNQFIHHVLQETGSVSVRPLWFHD